MQNLSKKDRDNLIKLLQDGKDDVAKERAMKIFELEEAESQKEYELKYKGKAREEDIIADTLAAPLQEVRTFHSDSKFDDDWTNKLIFGDNLMALKNLYEDPNIKGKVKLIYIDPPFATKHDFMKDKEKAYRDKVVGSKFIEFLRKRLIILKELLSDEGSIYVHLDWKKSHYIKVIMDDIFDESNFIGDIIWNYGSPSGGRTAGAKLVKSHDTILQYAKDYGNHIYNPVFLSYNDKYVKEWFKFDDGDGRKYRKRWRRDESGESIFEKQYLDESKGVPASTVWNDIQQVYADPRAYKPEQKDKSELVDYPTQKPEKLLQRVIALSSNEGDIILDAFAGSGTTLAVAEKLNRRWIGIDCGKLAIYTMQKRMLNLREEIGNKGKSHKAKTFTLYNAGLYDWLEIKKLDFGNYRDFVLKLFQVREEKHTVKGIEIDGYIGDDNAYLWNHTTDKKAKLDLDFVNSLHSAISGKGGDVFYIIAPTNAFAFYEDEIKHDKTIYKTLRVPQSVIAELINRGGETIKQPTSEQDVNDTIDAVGFDFIQAPKVEATYKIGKPKETNLFNQKTKECIIKIDTFRSRTLTKSPEEFENYETLSMVMVDYNYDGKVFDLDEVFYADKIKPDFEVRFDREKIDDKMMVIYLDIYGNEKKEILSLKDFKK